MSELINEYLDKKYSLVRLAIKSSTVVHLDTHPNELKTYVSTKTCTQMFVTALSIIAET